MKKIDSKRFITGHSNGAVCVWELTDSKYSLLRQIGEHESWIYAIEMTANNDIVIGDDKGHLAI